MARAMGATLTGAQKCLANNKIFTYSFLNLNFASRTSINCKGASNHQHSALI